MNTAMTVLCDFCEEEIRPLESRVWVHDVEDGDEVQIHTRCLSARHRIGTTERYSDTPTERNAS